MIYMLHEKLQKTNSERVTNSNLTSQVDKGCLVKWFCEYDG
jgi:hypothetical protein